jgi:hypothetical protein
MEDRNDVQIAPVSTANAHPRVSRWQRFKGFGLRKLFLVCVGIGAGLGIGIVATVASVSWLTSRPIPAREWPRLEVQGVGLRAKLKTDWNDDVRYQLMVAPRSDDLKAAFDRAVRSHRDSISFTVHLYDKAGFELCKKDVKQTPSVDAEGHIDELRANDTFYSYECSRSNYKEADHWNLSYVFPPLTADTPLGGVPDHTSFSPNSPFAEAVKRLGMDKPDVSDAAYDVFRNQYFDQRIAPRLQPSEREKQRAVFLQRTQRKSPSLGESASNAQDDTLTGFDSFSGHLETLSGGTYLVREGEKDVASMWNIRSQIEGKGQPRLRITCKTADYCVIENTTNDQAVHGKKIR